jgi:hypothetical protein
LFGIAEDAFCLVFCVVKQENWDVRRISLEVITALEYVNETEKHELVRLQLPVIRSGW